MWVEMEYVGRISIFQLIFHASVCWSCVTKRKAHGGFVVGVIVTECTRQRGMCEAHERKTRHTAPRTFINSNEMICALAIHLQIDSPIE